MSNGVSKPLDDLASPPTSEFEECTNVMESGLLRVLTKKSTAGTGEQSAIVDELQIDVTVEPPPLPPDAETTEAETTERDLPPVSEHAPPPTETETTTLRAPAPPALAAELTMAVATERAKRSPLMVAAAIVAAVVIAADVAIFVSVRLRSTRQSAPLPQSAPPSLPTYMVLPAGSTMPPALRDQPAGAPPPLAEAAKPEAPSPVPPPHVHRHHKRSRSSR